MSPHSFDTVCTVLYVLCCSSHPVRMSGARRTLFACFSSLGVSRRERFRCARVPRGCWRTAVNRSRLAGPCHRQEVCRASGVQTRGRHQTAPRARGRHRPRRPLEARPRGARQRRQAALGSAAATARGRQAAPRVRATRPRRPSSGSAVAPAPAPEDHSVAALLLFLLLLLLLFLLFMPVMLFLLLFLLLLKQPFLKQPAAQLRASGPRRPRKRKLRATRSGLKLRGAAALMRVTPQAPRARSTP